ncbi:hypothetical protein ACFL0Q_09620, partial [Thermodesulfobacteriota bacterium]
IGDHPCFEQNQGLSVDWKERFEEPLEDRGLGIDGLISSAEMSHGIISAITSYSVFENAIRHGMGHSVKEHLEYMAKIMTPFLKKAGDNPYTMFHTLPTAETLKEVSVERPFLSIPYHRDFCAKEKVNMAAAVILTSQKKAGELGIPEEKRIYLHAHSGAMDRVMSERSAFDRSDAMQIAIDHLFKHSSLSIGDIDFFDIYSCFPSAVISALEAMALSVDDPRPFTLTGGLPYFGGPGNNYSMHGIVEVVEKARETTDGFGLVLANGGMLSKAAAGVYSRAVPDGPWKAYDKRATQASIEAIPYPRAEVPFEGRATIESYALNYGRGTPVSGIVFARPAGKQGTRTLAAVSGEDEATISLLQQDDVIGETGEMRLNGEFCVFSVA